MIPKKAIIAQQSPNGPHFPEEHAMMNVTTAPMAAPPATSRARQPFMLSTLFLSALLISFLSLSVEQQDQPGYSRRDPRRATGRR